MTQSAEPGATQAKVQHEATQRLFLRALLVSEHLVFLVAGCYSLWTREEWRALGLDRVRATGVLGLGVAMSFLIAMVLAAAVLRCRSPLWFATLAGGVLGPLLGAGAILLILSIL